LLASPALGAEPQREAAEASVTFPDFFAGSGQECAFPVVGQWDASVQVVTYFDQATGNPVRVITFVDFNGTLSNPLSGKSIPDWGHFKRTDYFAADGSLIRDVDVSYRGTPLLHAAFHNVNDAEGNILADG
jgi:hypothetical protein